MINHRLLTALLFVSLTALITSCANISKPDNNKPLIYKDYIAENKLESQTKITSFRFRAWRSLDNKNLIISASYDRPYLLTLSNYCVDLTSANAIRVNSTGSILQAKFDSVTPVRNRGGKCLIDSIYKISKKQADELTALKKSKKNLDEKLASETKA